MAAISAPPVGDHLASQSDTNIRYSACERMSQVDHSPGSAALFAADQGVRRMRDQRQKPMFDDEVRGRTVN
jgi:hypothetical protein